MALMDSLLIATAGHVDHGKSTLVRALTGIDPDRWEEEKQRGITIDLGYAFLEHQGRTFSFVDVPGHEKFIHNMLAGVGSIDGVLFVIAADESIMPQTREHAAALHFLGVTQVCVVLTKIDLVSPDLLELLNLEVDEWLAEYGWDTAPRVGFSSKQDATRSDVLAALAAMHKRVPADRSGFRLSVDRVFTSPGSGTVITGTTDRGSLNTGDTVTLLPGGAPSRIRQMQVHGQNVNHVGPHMRVAVNLSDVHYKELKRGALMFTGEPPIPHRKLLIRLHGFNPDWTPSTKHLFHVHHLAARLSARLLWREDDFGVLVLMEDYPFQALDRGLIRDGAPLQVIAGFEVLLPDLNRPKKKALLPLPAPPPKQGDLADWLRWYIEGFTGLTTWSRLQALCGEPPNDHVAQLTCPVDDRHFMPRSKMGAARERFLETLKSAHKERPFFGWLPMSLVHARFPTKSWPAPLVQKLLNDGVAEGTVIVEGDRVRLKTHRAVWSKANFERLQGFLAPLKDNPPIIDLRTVTQFRDPLMEQLLTWEKFLVNLTPDILVQADFLDRITTTLHGRFHGQSFSVGDLKTTFNFTRKLAIPLLEYLDKSGYTRREGDNRVWIAAEPPINRCSWQRPNGPG